MIFRQHPDERVAGSYRGAHDVAQTAVRGELFEPRIYPLFVLHYAGLAGIGIPVANRRYQGFLAW